MSMEINVFFRGDLPSKAALTQGMAALGFPLAIVHDEGALDEQNGFMPMLLDGKETGVEFDIFSPIRQDWLDKTDDYLRR